MSGSHRSSNSLHDADTRQQRSHIKSYSFRDGHGRRYVRRMWTGNTVDLGSRNGQVHDFKKRGNVLDAAEQAGERYEPIPPPCFKRNRTDTVRTTTTAAV